MRSSVSIEASSVVRSSFWKTWMEARPNSKAMRGNTEAKRLQIFKPSSGVPRPGPPAATSCGAKTRTGSRLRTDNVYFVVRTVNGHRGLGVHAQNGAFHRHFTMATGHALNL